MQPRSGTFGYGQAVMSNGAGVHFAGSEPRHDGAAIPEAPKVSRAAYFPDAVTEVTPQQRPQRDAIGVADARGNFIDALVARLQQVDGALDAQALKIRERRLPEHRLHPARERALAGRDGFRGVVQREPVREPRARPSFEPLHHRIVVNQVVGQRVRGLRRSRIDDQVLRRQRGKSGTELPDEPEREIDVTQRRAGGDEPCLI